MKTRTLKFIPLLLLAGAVHAQDLRTFSNAEGKTLEDKLVRYDYGESMVTLERSGKVPLDTFSKADQDYILRWNMVAGFKSTMRFKTEIKKSNWARMKSEKAVTPYWMDAVQISGKTTPSHTVVMIDDYEEYTALYLEAEGYSITLRNQNLFPLEDIVVESKIYYEQELYVTPDDMFTSMENEYNDTITTNTVKFTSETISVIIPREEVVVHSECAITVDHQVDRTSLISETDEESDDSGEEDEEGDEDAAEVETVIEGFGDWDDHGRRRKGSVDGIWVRIGIKGPDGEMIWREMTDPTSLPRKVSWDPVPESTEP